MCSVIVHIDFQDLAVNISHQNGQKSWSWGETNQNWSVAHRHLSSTSYEHEENQIIQAMEYWCSQMIVSVRFVRR